MSDKIKRVYNCQPPKYTGEEKKFGVEHHVVETAALPSSFDLRTASTFLAPVVDQLQLGSCVANELSNALRFAIGKETGVANAWQPSRLFLYYFGRLYDGNDVTQDSGMSITGACSSIAKYGAPVETLWAYDTDNFAVQPPRAAILEAHKHTPNYQFLQVAQDLTSIKHALVSGFPVVIGIQLYSDFESDNVAKYGVVNLPTSSEILLGGHCVAICAFSDSTQRFTCSNSWGTSWGYKGYFTIPYAYVLDPNLGDDFNQIRYFK